MLGPVGTVLATVTIVSLIENWFKESFTLAVKLITSPLVSFIVMFWEKVAVVVSFNEKLKYLTNPDILTIIWPKLNPVASVTFTVILITSLTVIFVNDLFNVAFIIGTVASKEKLTLKLSW